MTQPTLGFTGPGDISVQSVLPDHRCVVNCGIQITANLWNLNGAAGCSQAEQGSVDFYWVPFGWPTVGSTVYTPDVQTGLDSAQAIGPDGQLDIPQGQAFQAQICWSPTAAQIGLTGKNYVKGAILAVGVSGGNSQCGAVTPPIPNPPYTQLSGWFSIYATDTVVRNPFPCLLATGENSQGQASTFVYVGFVFPNHSSKASETRIVARCIRARNPLPPVVPPKKEGYTNRPAAKAIAGATTLVDAEVRVGLGQVRARTTSPGFMSQMYTGFVDAPVADSLLDKNGLSPERLDTRLEPWELRQGILEVAIPIQGSTTTCLIDVAYVDTDGKRQGGFLVSVSSDGTID